MLVYFWSRHALWDLFYVNVLWPSQHYSAVNVVPYAQGVVRYYWDHYVIAKSWLSLDNRDRVSPDCPFVFVAALTRPAAGTRRWIHKKQNFAGDRTVLALWLALWFSEFHRKDICHLVFGSPLLMILCIYYLQQYRAKAADLTLQFLAITAGCLAGV